MRLRKKNKYQGGGGVPDNTRVSTPRPPQEMLSDYNRLPDYDPTAPPPSGGIRNTFGPLDYLIGTFPLVRALTPAARAVSRALGMPPNLPPTAPPMARPVPPEPSISFTDPMGMPTNPFLEMVPSPNPEVAFLKELERLYTTDPGGKELISTIFNATEGPYRAIADRIRKEAAEEVGSRFRSGEGNVLGDPMRLFRYSQELADEVYKKAQQYVRDDVAQRDLTGVADLVDGRIIDEELFAPYVKNAHGGKIRVLKNR